MSKADLQAMLDRASAAYKARGGVISTIPEGERSAVPDKALGRCRCGCEGDYTEHTMRAGESGRCSSIIIR